MDCQCHPSLLVFQNSLLLVGKRISHMVSKHGVLTHFLTIQMIKRGTGGNVSAQTDNYLYVGQHFLFILCHGYCVHFHKILWKL